MNPLEKTFLAVAIGTCACLAISLRRVFIKMEELEKTCKKISTGHGMLTDLVGAIGEKVKRLENTEDLNTEDLFDYEAAPFGEYQRTGNYWRWKVTVKDALKLVVDHLGLEIKHIEATPSKMVIEPKKKGKK